ncbi:MAG: M23 family metallopeptidase [Thiomicrospira sp.]|jgi:murein DD-endopeptidase MepM/ murein hydrolase activator NlpD|nr:M23 family metallopeptidase [Thiomicrospira sp.]
MRLKRGWGVGLILLAMSSSLAAKELVLRGEPIQGGWVEIVVAPESRISFEGRSLKADAQGRLLLAFPRDAKPSQHLTIQPPEGKPYRHTLAVKQREYVIQRINGVPSKYVTPDEATLKKIREDRQKAVNARKINLPEPYFSQGFRWPTEGWVTGVYGSQRILNGHARNPHMGVDIAAPIGTPIYAPAAGEVTLAESMELSGFTLFIDHGYGLRSDFMHLDKILVKPGERVKKGQLVATMGTTGRSTGSHLHWGMSWFDVRLDPALVFNLPTPLRKGAQIVANEVVYEQEQVSQR